MPKANKTEPRRRQPRRWPVGGRVGVLAFALAALSACAPPATLEKRAGYWSDQSQSARAFNHRVRFLVIHYTGGNEAHSLQALTGPSVSSHYLVSAAPESRGGTPIVRQLVAEQERAWHAGSSAWGDRSQLNDSSIGIEIVNVGPLDSPTGSRWDAFDRAQIDAVIALARDIVRRYGIEPQNVVAHADIAPGRKIDPGPAFPWQQLYRRGIGAWPDESTVSHYRQRFMRDMPSIAEIQSQLARYGYQLPVTGRLDQRTHSVLVSFQMHFRPARYDGVPDAGTAARLWALNAKYR